MGKIQQFCLKFFER